MKATIALLLALLPSILRADCASRAFIRDGPAGGNKEVYGWSLGAADFNGDGALDLVVGGSRGAFLLLHGGPEPGNFQEPVAISATSVSHLAIGDVNRDGKQDIVFTSVLKNTITTLLGIGDGTFTAVSFQTPSPKLVALADMNGDGFLDIVATAEYPSTTLSIFPGNGNGTFGDPFQTPAPSSIIALAVADLDGDGLMDVITGTGVLQSDPQIEVWLGRGDGTVKGALAFATPKYPWSIAIADLDGDGRLDVITANAVDQSISILRNKGGGLLDAAVTYVPPSIPLYPHLTPQFVIAGAFLGTGRTDLAVAAEEGFLLVFPSLGNGTFGAPESSWLGGQIYPEGIIALDLDGDGRLDFAIGNEGPAGGAALMENKCAPPPPPAPPKRRAAPHS